MERWEKTNPVPLNQSVLQWGHRLSAMESYQQRWHRRVGYVLQWGHRLSAMESLHRQMKSGSRDLGFNGATAFRRWKGGDLWVADDDDRASMGPPPFGDGKP